MRRWDIIVHKSNAIRVTRPVLQNQALFAWWRLPCLLSDPLRLHQVCRLPFFLRGHRCHWCRGWWSDLGAFFARCQWFSVCMGQQIRQSLGVGAQRPMSQRFALPELLHLPAEEEMRHMQRSPQEDSAKKCLISELLTHPCSALQPMKIWLLFMNKAILSSSKHMPCSYSSSESFKRVYIQV